MDEVATRISFSRKSITLDRLRWMRLLTTALIHDLTTKPIATTNKMKHNKNLTALAQKLRKEMTKEEKHLWYQFLKHHTIHFKRQVTCGEYILDFYCPSAKLAIELDGYYHSLSENSEADKIRTDFLNSLGIFVMRFSNRDIWQDFNRVCNQIDFLAQKRAKELLKEDD